MQVVGKTSEWEIWVASSDRAFRLNELLIMEGAIEAHAVGEVVETYSLNPMVPMVDEGSPFMIDNQVMATLQAVGYELETDTVYVALVRMISELFYPVKTGSRVREPGFEEVKELLIKATPDKALCPGVIVGTEKLDDTLPDDLRGIAPLFHENQIQEQVGVPFLLDYRRMQDYPHIGIFGGSGSGKSFGIRVLIEELIIKKVPLLVFDPHYEMSFSEPLDDSGSRKDVSQFESSTVTLTVGQDIGVRFDTLSDTDLCNLLSSVMSLSEAMEAAVRTVLANKDSLKTFADRLNNLMLILEGNEGDVSEKLSATDKGNVHTLKREIDKLHAIKNQVGGSATLKAISWRLYRLQQDGIFHDAGMSRIEEGIKAQKAVVVRGSMRILRVYAAYVLRNLYYQRRDYRDAIQKGLSKEKFPPFIVITDEAHNFAPKGDIPAPARREFREVAQEGRKYGVFLILATQRPALLDETINAQLNTKFIFRTVRSHDLSVISEETDLGREEIKRLPYIPSGYGFVSSPLIGRSIAVRIRAARTRSPHQDNPFDELQEMTGDLAREVMPIIEKYLPINETDMNELLKDVERHGIRMSRTEFYSLLDNLICSGEIIRDESGFIPQFRKAHK
ncbi:MAG: ATP-binding protein [Acidobacteriota bacterium]